MSGPGELVCGPCILERAEHIVADVQSTAMPSASRTFRIPSTASPGCSEISITLTEPSLTGDNLGHKTWVASYLLAKRLPHLLPLLPRLSPPASPCLPRILELGAGTGLIGIAFASLFPTHVSLTDLPSIIPNLAVNLSANIAHVSTRGSVADAFALDWAQLPPPNTLSDADKYDVIIAADSLYSPEHPELLVNTIEAYLKSEDAVRVVVELPLRKAYERERDEMKMRMRGIGLVILEEGEERGWDDWVGRDGRAEVKCWWGVWAREKVPEV